MESTKCIGVNVDKNLTWDGQMQSIRHEAISYVRILKNVKPLLKCENLIGLCRSIIEP